MPIHKPFVSLTHKSQLCIRKRKLTQTTTHTNNSHNFYDIYLFYALVLLFAIAVDVASVIVKL